MLNIDSYIENRIPKLDVEGKALLIISDGNLAGQSYIKSKVKMAQQLGIKCDVYYHQYPSHDVYHLLQMTKVHLSAYTGVIVQYPFHNLSFEKFKHYVQILLPPKMDIDGLVYPNYIPCTPLGIYNYCSHLGLDDYLIIGRGKLIGQPLSSLLLSKGKSVQVADSKTTRQALKDMIFARPRVIVCATPVSNLIGEELYSPDCYYIDCGCNYEGRKLIGNVSRDLYSEQALITPVPGGVGRLTVLTLMENLCGLK